MSGAKNTELRKNVTNYRVGNIGYDSIVGGVLILEKSSITLMVN